jgi:hypothetical protein
LRCKWKVDTRDQISSQEASSCPNLAIIIIIKISGNNTRKAFNRCSTKNSCTRNITHYKESATIRNLKPEWWGSPLVQEEKYQGKPAKRKERKK